MGDGWAGNCGIGGPLIIGAPVGVVGHATAASYGVLHHGLNEGGHVVAAAYFRLHIDRTTSIDEVHQAGHVAIVQRSRIAVEPNLIVGDIADGCRHGIDPCHRILRDQQAVPNPSLVHGLIAVESVVEVDYQDIGLSEKASGGQQQNQNRKTEQTGKEVRCRVRHDFWCFRMGKQCKCKAEDRRKITPKSCLHLKICFSIKPRRQSRWFGSISFQNHYFLHDLPSGSGTDAHQINACTQG